MKDHSQFLLQSISVIFLIIIIMVGHVPGRPSLLSADASLNVRMATSSVTSTSAGVDTPTLSDVLRQLQNEVQSLHAQMAEMQTEISKASLENMFTRTLKRGDSGADVSKLQELFLKFPEVYPSDINLSSTLTGYYGYLTETTVSNFQKKEGLKETGVFSTSTRESLVSAIGDMLLGQASSAAFVPLDVSGLDSQASGYITDLQTQVSQLVADDSSTQSAVEDLGYQISELSTSVSNMEGNLAALSNQVQGGIGPSAAPVDVPINTTPTSSSSSTAVKLTISGVQAKNMTKTSSTIIWTTSAPSTSEVDYSKTSNAPASQMTVVTSAVATTSHSMVLQNLSFGTTYYFRVISKGTGGSSVSSTQQSFKTLP